MVSSRPAATVSSAIAQRTDKLILYMLKGSGNAKNFEGYKLTALAAKMINDIADLEGMRLCARAGSHSTAKGHHCSSRHATAMLHRFPLAEFRIFQKRMFWHFRMVVGDGPSAPRILKYRRKFHECREVCLPKYYSIASEGQR
jgi:hypothetical protein